ncbi:hypothetical protein D3C75_1212340 [compost metagenome]
MSDQQLSHMKSVGVRLPAERFHALHYYARQHEMPVREFLAYMVESYIDAMKASKAKGQ